ncbi:MAG: hypothetical protein DHS20C14_11150 [Phycisphaeraceae bacterium]|nr:MAG: hypothetical protein DHS20C14_11150 [Phycisphaeraceae bacterium]
MIWIAIVVGLVIFAGWRAMNMSAATGHAPKPVVFAGDVRLDDAIARSAAEGKPVLALATADWCGPCQALKRGALSDERVATLINERMIAVYVDVDAYPDEARMLGASSIPTTYLIRDGEIADRTTGVLGARQYLAWLEGTLEAPAAAGG